MANGLLTLKGLRVLIENIGGLASGAATFLGTPSSANLRALVTDETGTGSLFFQSGNAGTPSAIVLTNGTGLPLSTGVTGVLPAANGGAGTVSGILKANGSGTVSAAVSSTDYAPATSGSAILKGNGSGGFSNAAAGTDYLTAASTNTLTNKTYDTAGTGNSFAINGVAVTANSGTGAVVRVTSPALVTPALGTPTSGNLASCTGYTLANLAGLGSNVGTFLATPSSANLAAALTDETGSGSAVFGTSPTLAAPLLTSGVFDSPQGRLTLTTGVPVQRADATAQTTVYYTPSRGAHIPIYNGTQFVMTAFSEISVALDSNSGHTGYQQSGKNFDLFVVNDAGTVRLATGPAWTSDTARANAISLLNGIWVNTAGSLTVRFGSASGNTLTIGASQATYVGTMRATADGQTGMAFRPAAAAGGTNNILGLYNAYNRVNVKARMMDNTGTPSSYTTAAWRAANASNSARISFIDGLQQSFIEARYPATWQASATSGVGVSLDSTSTVDGQNGIQAVNVPFSQPSENCYLPQIGFHFVSAVEFGGTLGSFSYNGLAALFVSLEM